MANFFALPAEIEEIVDHLTNGFSYNLYQDTALTSII